MTVLDNENYYHITYTNEEGEQVTEPIKKHPKQIRICKKRKVSRKEQLKMQRNRIILELENMQQELNKIEQELDQIHENETINNGINYYKKKEVL